jgi:predicted MFS family arabinose efflux permease
VRLILVLSLAPAIGLGVGRFAYSLVLPDMRETLGWTYSAAGFMNTINAAGYLAGALVAAAMSKRFGLYTTVRVGTVACVVALLICGLTANFAVLSFARLLTGFGAAINFIAGGALAATLAQAQPERAGFNLSLFYAGPGLGIVLSGLMAPFLLQGFGPGSWWIVWLALTVACTVLSLPLLTQITVSASPTGVGDHKSSDVPMRPIAIYLVSYFLFGAGYIAYMTFMIAYVRDAGGGAGAQSAFWCLIGGSAFVAPWVWRRVLERGTGGSTALILAVNAIGATLPLFGHSPLLLGASALVFGVAFFAVVASVTGFVRANYARDAWAKGIGLMTIVFGIGQTLGPIGIGAITDATGSLTSALVVSAATLGVGAVLAAFQRGVGNLTPPSS